MVTTCSVVIPSISRSGESIIRCLKTGNKDFFTSSGVTKSLPCIAAKALEAVIIAKEALGEAPKYK